MASPGELVRVLAEILVVPEPTMIVHDRNLVIAGLRSKGGRGRSAAKVTPRDAAHLLTAFLASAEVRDSAHSVERYTATRPQHYTSSEALFGKIGIKELTALPLKHSFIDALEALIASAATGSLAHWLTAEASGAAGRKIDVAPLIEVTAMSPGTVGSIRIAGMKSRVTADVRYALPNPWDKHGSRILPKKELDAWEARIKKYRVETGFDQYRCISAKIILGIAETLANEKEKQ